MRTQTRDNGTVWVGKLPVLLFGLGFAWAAAGSIRLLTSTHYLGMVTEAGRHADPRVGQVTVSLASANGAWVVGLLSLVTILFGLPFGVTLTHPTGQRSVGWTIGLLVLAFSIISGFSVGLTYLPAALLVIAGAALSPA
jgi:hypothetical protein